MTEQNNSESKFVRNETPVSHNEKAQKAILIMGGILVSALILSMFVGGDRHAAKPQLPLPQSAITNSQHNKPDEFFERVKLNATSNDLEASKDNALDRVRERYNHKEPASWQKGEKMRVLNSRKVGFGFDIKHKSKPAPGTNTAQSFTTLERGTVNRQPLTRKQEYRRRQHNFNMRSENIVGHAVNRRYKDSVKDGELLIPVGTVISAALDQEIISDYTGPWRGIITQDVYSIDNDFILMPKGTQLIGQSLHITNVNEPIQNRLGLTVQWAVLPNGKRLDFRKQSMQDRTGLSAVAGEVNRHLMWQFTGVAAYALLSASMPRDAYNHSFGGIQPTFNGMLADGVRGQLSPVINKYLSLVPTVQLRAGTPIKVFVQTDMYSLPWERVNKTVY